MNFILFMILFVAGCGYLDARARRLHEKGGK